MSLHPALLFSLALAALPSFANAQAQPNRKFAVTDPAVAAEDSDFRLQGEFLGRIRSASGGRRYTGVQVVARGNGKFDAVHYEGGLPGAGWNRLDKWKATAERDGDSVSFETGNAKIVVDELGALVHAADGSPLGRIRRINRVSPTLGAQPPAAAKVLFDGSNVSHFQNGRMTEDGLLQMGTQFAEAFGNAFTLHIEYRLPYMPYATGQQRANSGVYLHSRYEVQILDSFGLDGVENESAALYRQRRPSVNMALPPLRWQTYDITFTGPRFDESGAKIANGRITVLHNGVPVHDDVEILSKTGAGRPEGPQPLPTKLQDHGNPVVFRNIWIVDGKGHTCRCCR